MPSKETQLAARCTFLGGFAFSDQYQGHQEGDLPFIKVSDMSAAGNEKYIRAASNWVDSNLAKEKRWHPAPAGGVVFAKVGAALKLNRRRILSQPTLFDNNMMVAIPENGTDTAYLYHLLNSIDFNRLVQEGAVPSITQGLLGRIAILNFSQREQKVIGYILDTIDDAIEATQGVIKQTRQLKTALLQDLLSRGLPQKRRKFKSTKRFSNIPADWQILSLKEIGDSRRPALRTGPFGSSLKTEHFTTSGRPVLTIGSLGEGEVLEDQLFYVDEVKADEFSEYEVEPGDVVFSRVADVGRSVTIPEWAKGWIISSNLMRIAVDTSRFDPWFLRQSLVHSPHLKGQMRRFTADAGREIVNSDVLSDLLFPMPTRDEQDKIAKIVRGLDQKILYEREVSAQFVKTKTALSQGLLTGRIPVFVAEKGVE